MHVATSLAIDIKNSIPGRGPRASFYRQPPNLLRPLSVAPTAATWMRRTIPGVSGVLFPGPLPMRVQWGGMLRAAGHVGLARLLGSWTAPSVRVLTAGLIHPRRIV